MEANKRIRFVLFASGNGTNAQNIISYFQNDSKISFQCLICDNKDAAVISKVNKYKIPVHILEKEGLSRRAHELKIEDALSLYTIDYILLCGYMRILTSKFISKYKNIINIHPSLLPKYKGLNAYEKAFQSDDSFHGATVHFVDDKLDSGPIILQDRYQKIPNESFESFVKRGLELEHSLYPKALEKIIYKGETI